MAESELEVEEDEATYSDFLEEVHRGDIDEAEGMASEIA